jgi:asparagine synthase (glutamine-hydrolysing)
MDKRLIDLCLALPPEQKLFNGWSRIVMRRAMSGILPEKIRWRGGKTDMNPNFLRGLLKSDRNALEEAVFNRSQVIEKYIDIRVLGEVYRRLDTLDKVRMNDAMAIWKAVTLGYWFGTVEFGTDPTL